MPLKAPEHKDFRSVSIIKNINVVKSYDLPKGVYFSGDTVSIVREDCSQHLAARTVLVLCAHALGLRCELTFS